MRTSTYRFFNPVFLVPVAAAVGLALAIFEAGPIPVAGLCVLLWLALFVCRRPLLLVLVWLAVPLINEIAQGYFVTLGHVGPILLLPQDVAIFFTIVFLVSAAVSRPSKSCAAVKADPFLVLFLAVVLASVIWFTPMYGKMAIGEARKEYYAFLFPLLAALYVNSLSDLNRLLTAIYCTAGGMALVSLFIFLQHPSLDWWAVPINGETALINLFVLFSIVISHANNIVLLNKLTDRIMALAFLSVILLTRTRTVFLAAAFGILILFWLAPRKVSFLRKALAVSMIFLIAIGAALLIAPVSTRKFVSPLHGIIDPSSDADASWRMRAWRQQFSGLSDTEFLWGKGLGSYFKWNEHAQNVTIPPHNVFVEIIVKFGLFGVALYGVLVFSFLRRMLAIRRALPAGIARACVEMSILNVGATQAYMTGYGFPLFMFIFYGLGRAAEKLAGRASQTRVAALHAAPAVDSAAMIRVRSASVV